MRISREQAFMETAYVWAKRSTCARLNVGAIIVANNRIISCGYNGHAPGAPHCELNECAGMVPGGCGTTHAEINALSEVHDRLKDYPLHLYVTDSPCEHCCWAIIRDGRITRVVFATPYRITSGLDNLLQHGIEVFKLTPAGFMMNWQTREVINAI